jgi:hypothetical protein
MTAIVHRRFDFTAPTDVAWSETFDDGIVTGPGLWMVVAALDQPSERHEDARIRVEDVGTPSALAGGQRAPQSGFSVNANLHATGLVLIGPDDPRTNARVTVEALPGPSIGGAATDARTVTTKAYRLPDDPVVGNAEDLTVINQNTFSGGDTGRTDEVTLPAPGVWLVSASMGGFAVMGTTGSPGVEVAISIRDETIAGAADETNPADASLRSDWTGSFDLAALTFVEVTAEDLARPFAPVAVDAHLWLYGDSTGSLVTFGRTAVLLGPVRRGGWTVGRIGWG